MRKECANCIFYKDKLPGDFRSGYGKCHRYPQPAEVNDGHWCGEYYAVEAKND